MMNIPEAGLGVDGDVVFTPGLTFVGRVPLRPVGRVQGTVLASRHSIPALEIRSNKTAARGGTADVDAAHGVKLSVRDSLHTEIGVVAVAIERRVNRGSVFVYIRGPTRDLRNAVDVDLLDIGVGTGHDDVELLLELTKVARDILSDGAAPKIALDASGGRGVRDGVNGIDQGTAFEEDAEGVAIRGVVASSGA
jgi:hypothetical protein